MRKIEAAGPKAAKAPSTENDTEAHEGPSSGSDTGRTDVVEVLHKDRPAPAPDTPVSENRQQAEGDGGDGAEDRAADPGTSRLTLRGARRGARRRSSGAAGAAPTADPGAEAALPDDDSDGSPATPEAEGKRRTRRKNAGSGSGSGTRAAAKREAQAEDGADAEQGRNGGKGRSGNSGGGRDETRNRRRKRAKTSKLNVSPRKAGAPAIPVMPPAPAARRKRRHVGILLSFLLLVVAPVSVVGWYLYERAADQYASSMGFSVRKEDSASASEVIGGLIDFGGGDTSDTDILYEYIQSQALVDRINKRINLTEIYSKPENDWFFTIAPDAPIEDLVSYWRRMVTIYYDGGTGLIETRVLAFTPEDAQLVTEAIFDESTATINRLTSIARDDATKYARNELEQAQERLREARANLTEFRARTQIVDPAIDVQGQMGLLTTLQAQLAEALIELDLLRDNTRDADPRIRQAEQRIDVIENRIAEERKKFGVGETGAGGQAYVSLVGEYETLTVDREFAEQTYLAAQANFDAALAEAQRQTRYLAAYTMPTLAESSEYPQRAMLLGVVALFALGVWSVGALIYYSIRDRR